MGMAGPGATSRMRRRTSSRRVRKRLASNAGVTGMEDVVTGLFAPGVLRNRPPLSTLWREFWEGTAIAGKGGSSEAEVRAALAEVRRWEQQGDANVKTYDVQGLKAAVALGGHAIRPA